MTLNIYREAYNIYYEKNRLVSLPLFFTNNVNFLILYRVTRTILTNLHFDWWQEKMFEETD